MAGSLTDLQGLKTSALRRSMSAQALVMLLIGMPRVWGHALEISDIGQFLRGLAASFGSTHFHLRA